MKKLKQYAIFKINVNKFADKREKQIKIDDLTASTSGELVTIQENQLTNLLHSYFAAKSEEMPPMQELLVNVFVSQDAKGKTGERNYKELATNGFRLNGKRYVRLCSGAGQIRRNTVTFIRKDLCKPIYKALLCGLSDKDFGEDFNAAKFNAYFGLNMSGCHLLPRELSPRVCIIDDMEIIRPHEMVNHVKESKVKWIATDSGDYVLKEGQTDFEIADDNKTAIRKSDGIKFNIIDETKTKYVKKYINTEYYDEIKNSPAINSFDGQGLASPEWMERVATELGFGYIPSEIIIRAPWVKGLLACVPFSEYFEAMGIDTVTDSFGTERKVSEIDVFISKSQFKMAKIYAKKAKKNENAWDIHTAAMVENGLLWGVVKGNARQDDDVKTLNYQYLNALELNKAEIEELCNPTVDYLNKLNGADLQEVYNNLMQFSNFDGENVEYKPLWQKALAANPAFIEDRFVRSLIVAEVKDRMKAAKIGKILVRGNYQFCVSDPLAQLQWIAKKHCGTDIEVTGAIPADSVYSNYWRLAKDNPSEIVLMRSPLIDRNEITKRKLMTIENSLFRCLKSGIVLSIHSLAALAMGGCDFDGDILFSTNEPLILKGSLDYGAAKPLYYALGASGIVGAITKENLIEADARGMNNRVGTISNKAGILWAMLAEVEKDGPEYSKIYESIIALGQIVGMEIDRTKTGVYPTEPIDWHKLQILTVQTENKVNGGYIRSGVYSPEQEAGIKTHNRYVPEQKPRFMRYVYNAIDIQLKEHKKAYANTAKWRYGMDLSEMIKICTENGAKDTQMQKEYEHYCRDNPVNNAPCVVNMVCDFMEQAEQNMTRQAREDGQNLLKKFVADFEYNFDVIKQIKEELNCYQYFLRSMMNGATGDDKDDKKQRYTIIDATRTYFSKRIFAAVDGDISAAFAYLIKCAENEKTVWDLMGDNILKVINE